MLRLFPTTRTPSSPGPVRRDPIVAAAAVGAALGVAFLLLYLSGVPVLGWLLLAAAVVVALADIALTAAGRRSLSIVERLMPRSTGDE